MFSSPRLTLFLRLCLTLVLGFWLAHALPLETVSAALRTVTVPTVVAVFFAHLVIVLLSVFRWRAVLGTLGLQPSPLLFDDIRLTFMSAALNTILPTGLVGDAVRSRSVVTSHNASTATSISAVLLDRGFGLLALSLITGVVVAAARAPLWVQLAAGLQLGFSAALIMALYAFPRIRAVQSLSVARFLPPAWKLRDAAPVLGLSLAIQMLFASTYFVLSQDITPSQWPAAFSVALVLTLATAIPVTFSGLGLRELSFSTAFASVGLAAESGVAMSLCHWAAVTAVGVVALPFFLVAPARPEST